MPISDLARAAKSKICSPAAAYSSYYTIINQPLPAPATNRSHDRSTVHHRRRRRKVGLLAHCTQKLQSKDTQRTSGCGCERTSNTAATRRRATGRDWPAAVVSSPPPRTSQAVLAIESSPVGGGECFSARFSVQCSKQFPNANAKPLRLLAHCLRLMYSQALRVATALYCVFTVLACSACLLVSRTA